MKDQRIDVGTSVLAMLVNSGEGPQLLRQVSVRPKRSVAMYILGTDLLGLLEWSVPVSKVLTLGSP